jgi:hypothetical protein
LQSVRQARCHGLHDRCDLARTEMHVAFATLARRLSGLALAVPAEQLIFQNNKEIYGVTELPVTW